LDHRGVKRRQIPLVADAFEALKLSRSGRWGERRRAGDPWKHMGWCARADLYST
jgi:hypothetical protein